MKMSSSLNPSAKPANAFFFDGNLWFGLVDSQERLVELQSYYPTKKYLQARLFTNGGDAYPCFGFNGDGISLEVFLTQQEMAIG
ncbi:hypothetical protein QE390_000841 [Siphonobacter sp. SORGH_AS 1065]|nr:hypothetical protein [Siphonobacter sp. SORGH_AS_1065]